MSAQNNQTYLTLNNGVRMPQFGLGVYSIPAGDLTYNSVKTALECGYRHIDTAHAYPDVDGTTGATQQNGNGSGTANGKMLVVYFSRAAWWTVSKNWPM